MRVVVSRRAAWVLAVGLLAVGPAVLPGRAQAGCAGVTVGRDGWTRVAAPEFYEPDGFVPDEVSIRAHAVVTGRPSTILVTDGQRVMRTTDRGCTWDFVLEEGTRIGQATVFTPLDGNEFIDLDTASYNTRSKRVYVLAKGSLVSVGVGDAGARGLPRVFVSDDDGATFRAASSGLPVHGEPLRIRVADGPDAVAYVAVADTIVGTESLYVTRNAGVSWTKTSGGSSILPSLEGSITDFAVDSGRPDQVWAWDDEALFRSTDSGATFRPVPEVTEPVSTMEFGYNGLGKISDVRAFHLGRATADYSAAPNLRWLGEEVPGAVLSVARTPGGEVRALGTSRDVFVTYPNLRTGAPIGPVGITPTGAVPEDLELGFDVRKQEPLLVGRTAAALLLRNPVKPPPPLPPLPKLPGIGRLDECVTDKLPGTSFAASTREVVLRPGESRTVGYALSIPPVPTDLDVNFMLDTTGSMSGVIAGLRKDIKAIVAGICDAGVPVQFGLADFREFEGPFGGGVSVGGGPDPDQYPYRRRMPVGPVGPALREAIEGLDVGGGAADGSDAALEAMLQAATGRGKKDATGAVLIEAGEGANFRPRSLKVIVLAIDTTWREATPGYPGPAYADVVAELVKRGIKVVGLAIGERSANGELLRTNKSDMERLGRATRTLAGPDGSDCDDDGTAEIAPGEPLVCVLEEFGRGGVTLAPAMIGLLNSIEDRASVGIEVLADPAVIAPGGLLARDGVNVKQPNRLAFDSVFTCTQSQFGRTTPVIVNAVSRGRVLATTDLVVRCGSPVRAPAPVLGTVVVPAVAAAVAPPPPPPPPAPIPQVQPQPQPNPNVNPQINPQPNLQANVGVVGQEQEQLDVALATVDIADDSDGQYAMSSVSDEDAAVQTASVLLGIGLTAGAAYGLSARRRTQAAPVHVRRDG
ncbi:MAG TPA: hypothetical protein VNB94_05000 [Mycobacteriales bacterium]|nr:hypothetical protein [Mycobacteriales bacterium]